MQIAVFSGKRGGYGAMKPLLRHLQSHPVFELSLILSDQHINENFGNTQEEVKNDFPKYSTLKMIQKNSSPDSRVDALSQIMRSAAIYLKKNKPDLVILYGDRSEVLTFALALIHFNIPIAHIQGGDTSGNIDDGIRHSLSHFAKYHFPSCDESKNKLIELGIKKETICAVGDCHLDEIYSKNYPRHEETLYSLNIDIESQFCIFLLHPDTLNTLDYNKIINPIIKYLLEIFQDVIAIYPCSDHGYGEIVDSLIKFKKNDNFHLYKNLDAPYFWSLMSRAKLFIGNSSAGIIETAAFKLPTVNIGDRQKGRLRPNHIVDTNYDLSKIKEAITKAMKFNFKEIKSPYGEGGANLKIIKFLESKLLC